LLFVSALSNQTTKLGPGFWNVRQDFYIDGFNIGTQMSLIQLTSGNFLVLDTVKLNTALLDDINTLTRNGTLLTTVYATHPFHTLFFPAFYQQFPKAAYYGTPRHLRIEPQIPWAGTVWDCSVRQAFLPEVHMRIPRGANYVDPVPETSNHFSGMHVFHVASQIIHVDDTIIIDEPFTGDMLFHPSLLTSGLFHIPAAPPAFSEWVQKMMREWDFTTIAAAHDGVRMNTAKEGLQYLLEESEIVFAGLILRNTISPNATQQQQFDDMNAHEKKCEELEKSRLKYLSVGGTKVGTVPKLPHMH